jgi:triacylglycerol lipase
MDRLLSRDVTKGLQRWMEEKSFVEYDSVFHLTTRYVRDEFNPATPNHPDVRYFALAGDITSGAFGTRPGPLAHTRFFLPHAVIRRKEGANDGLVSIDSALGAGLGGGETGTPAFESLGVVGLDHAELINQSRRYDGRALFRLILHNLAKNGF